MELNKIEKVAFKIATIFLIQEKIAQDFDLIVTKFGFFAYKKSEFLIRKKQKE